MNDSTPPAPGPAGPAGDGTFAPLDVALADGRHLLVRRLTPADADELFALYERLAPEDRRLRFMSTFHPPPAFVARWLAPERGQVLGAFVREAAANPEPAASVPAAPQPAGAVAGDRLVGEAGYALLPNGNGELGITTDAEWRGWLGPFLLDVLAAAARDAGVANIEADVRLDNRPMLGLIRHRGAAVVTPPGWGEIRLVMGTGGRVPGWPPHHDAGRVRVLVESPAAGRGPLGEADAHAVEVLSCAGPHGRPGGRCPLLDGGRCPLVDGADEIVVVTAEGGDPSFEALVGRHEARVDGPDVHRCGTAAAVGEIIRRLAKGAG